MLAQKVPVKEFMCEPGQYSGYLPGLNFVASENRETPDSNTTNAFAQL